MSWQIVILILGLVYAFVIAMWISKIPSPPENPTDQ